MTRKLQRSLDAFNNLRFDPAVEPGGAPEQSTLPPSIAIPLGAAPAPHPPADPPLAVLECLLLPPWMFGGMRVGDVDVPGLAEPTTLTLRTLDGGIWFVCTWAPLTYAELRAARATPVLDGAELGALALAAENERAAPAVLAGWLARKLGDASQPIDVAAALGGVQGAHVPIERWSLGRVLRAWRVELVGVAVGDGAGREVLA